jgi:histidinol dehydrogenase
MARTFLKKPAAAETHKATTNGSSPPSVDVAGIVKGVIDTIRKEGDTAVRRYSETFDKWSPPSGFRLSDEEIQNIISTVPEQVIKDIKAVQANVRKFAEAQKETVKDFELEISPGVFLGQKNNPIESVGA